MNGNTETPAHMSRMPRRTPDGARIVIASSTPAGGGRPALDETSASRHGLAYPWAYPGHPWRQSATTDGRDKPGHDGGSDAKSESGLMLRAERRRDLHRVVRAMRDGDCRVAALLA